jgi:hypothetical protein
MLLNKDLVLIVDIALQSEEAGGSYGHSMHVKCRDRRTNLEHVAVVLHACTAVHPPVDIHSTAQHSCKRWCR